MGILEIKHLSWEVLESRGGGCLDRDLDSVKVVSLVGEGGEKGKWWACIA